MIDRLRYGGTEKQLVSLIGHFDRSVIKPSLVLLDGSDETSCSLEPANLPVLRLGVTSLVSRHAFRQLRHLARFLQEETVQVLQVHFADSTYFGITAARIASVPYIVKTRRDLCYWTSRKHKFLGRPLDILFNKLFVDAILVNSNACKVAVTRDECMDPRRVLLINNGVDDRFLVDGINSKQPHPVQRVAVVAMLRPEKRLQDFVKAASLVHSKLPDTSFEIAGEGDERCHLESLIRELGLESHFRLVGKVEDTASYLSAVDVAVLCSETESMPNAVLEYMATGKPIVATNIGGIGEILTDESTALLVPPRDPPALAAAILRMLSDNALAVGCGNRARNAIRSTHQFYVVARQYEVFYSQLTRQSSNTTPGLT